MADKTSSARIYEKTLDQYRKWANMTGRNLTDLMNIALLFALRNQAQIEREVALKLEGKQ